MTFRVAHVSDLNVLCVLKEITPRELLEAAAVQGADGWQTFRFVTFPVLRTAIVDVLRRDGESLGIDRRFEIGRLDEAQRAAGGDQSPTAGSRAAPIPAGSPAPLAAAMSSALSLGMPSASSAPEAFLLLCCLSVGRSPSTAPL